MKFRDDIPSIPLDNFKNDYVLVFDSIWMQDANENCHYHELVGEPLKLELNIAFPPEHVTEVIVLGERMSPIAIHKIVVVGKNN